MRAVIFSFYPIKEKCRLPTTLIARFLSEETGFPIVFDELWDYKGNYDILFIVNGAYAFCKYLDVLAEVVRNAKRIIWLQNDYAIKPPIGNSNPTLHSSADGGSAFRKAFRTRADKGLSDTELWTTVRDEQHQYINWNSLTYKFHKRQLTRTHTNDLFYYGNYRLGRLAAFDQFFNAAPYTVKVSSPSSKFAARYPSIKTTTFIRYDFYRTLARHGVGLYIEDRASHKYFHSPANRFYEMLSAQLPMVFQVESVPLLREAGFDITPYVVTNSVDICYALQHREDFRVAQMKTWHDDHVEILRKRMKALLQSVGVQETMAMKHRRIGK